MSTKAEKAAYMRSYYRDDEHRQLKYSQSRASYHRRKHLPEFQARRRVNAVVTRYKVTPEIAKGLLGVQSCQACDKTFDGEAFKLDYRNIDHDPQSGRVRGVLCGSCNRALGMAKDNPELLRTLADYLEASHYCCS